MSSVSPDSHLTYRFVESLPHTLFPRLCHDRAVKETVKIMLLCGQVFFKTPILCRFTAVVDVQTSPQLKL